MPLALLHDPYEMFADWFQKAKAAEPSDPNAMTLATVGAGGRPAARTVLLKSFDDKGFIFFTNYNSRKARELLQNQQAGLLFYWKSVSRQVRIEGHVEKVSADESNEYFASRPELSQLGAWASHQSAPLHDRAELLERLAKYKDRYAGQNVPRPAHWGGYRLIPDYFEFWQAGDYRLHERAEFTPDGHGGWRTQLLNP